MNLQTEKILTEKNIPVTAVRLLVLNTFLESGKALSLGELEEVLYPTDRSTLYRTLKTFEKKGLLHGVQDQNTTQYLLCSDGCDEEHHHDYHLHFYCTVCRNTICLEEITFENVHLPDGYLFEEMKFVAHGICKSCHKS